MVALTDGVLQLGLVISYEIDEGAVPETTISVVAGQFTKVFFAERVVHPGWKSVLILARLGFRAVRLRVVFCARLHFDIVGVAH